MTINLPPSRNHIRRCDITQLFFFALCIDTHTKQEWINMRPHDRTV